MRQEVTLALVSACASVTIALSWTDAYARAQTALDVLSLENKVDIVTGVGSGNGKCVGNTPEVTKINYPGLCLQDGPAGVRHATGNTAFAAAITVGMSWNSSLAFQRGEYMAMEAMEDGVQVLLGPMVGPGGKNPQGGRNWEGFGSDPYLDGRLAAVTIEAMQGKGVQATVKHLLGNEQETGRDSISANIDDRTAHELYLWAFIEAIHANVCSIMCSYNRVNGTFACENDSLMNKIMKGQLGFLGHIMTDWSAQHSTVEAANAGLDMSMPGTDFNGGSRFWGLQLVAAVNNGQVNESRVDDMVRRILATGYMLGQDQGYPSVDLDRNVSANHRENVRATAREGIVLLKNDNNILPLENRRNIVLVGSAATKGAQAENQCLDMGCNNGAIGTGWGSGTVTFSDFTAPDQAIQERASSEGIQVTLSASDDPNAAAAAAQGKDLAIIFVTADSGEGYITVEGNPGDRNDLKLWHNGDELVKAVADTGIDVIVVAYSVGPCIVEDIVNLPQVQGFIWGNLPSTDGGPALVDIMFGDYTPSGKLVYTIARDSSHYNTAIQRGDSDDFSEGLLVEYKHFDSANIQPRYEFGFGLSYTNFTYSNLTIASSAVSGPATGPIVPGGPQDLFDVVATVSVTIQNTGPVQGAEVAQLYLNIPDDRPNSPITQLRGFDKLSLEMGEAKMATFELRKMDMSIWDVILQNWVVLPGTYEIHVGASSRDFKLSGEIVVE